MNTTKLAKLAVEHGWEVCSDLTVKNWKLVFGGDINLERDGVQATVQFTRGGGKMLAAGFTSDGVPQGFSMDVDQVADFLTAAPKTKLIKFAK